MKLDYRQGPSAVLIVGNYIIRYALFDEQVIILRIWLRIWHQRENWK
jgi:hypothetical protein